jgi:NMD protein affecting ribosome stability and mRNA decay
LAYACGHTTRSHYSSGMCQNCYLAKYYLARKQNGNLKPKRKSSQVTQQWIFNFF